MISPLLFTTLFASMAVSSVSAAFSVDKPKDLVQCSATSLKWNDGQAPFSVYVYTDCSDANDEPIFSATDIPGWSANWTVSALSGDGIFFEVVDATGASATSDDAWVGGDASKSDECAATLLAAKNAVVSASASTTATESATASPTLTGTGSAVAGVPTTMSRPASSVGYNANGVANAAKVSSSVSPTSTGLKTNAASSLLARPLEISIGLMAVGLAAML